MATTMNVAITGVGGGVGQSVIRALRRSRLPLRLIGLDANPWSAGLYQCDAQAVIPRVSAGETYLSALESVIAEYGVAALIPGTDTELYALACARERLERLRCRSIVSVPSFIGMARDKLLTYETLSKAGIPFVRTMSAQAFRQTGTAESFPVIVKPRDGSASVGARVIFNWEDFERGCPSDQDIVQDYLVPTSWKLEQVRPGDVVRGGRLRQEEEVSVQAAVGPDGRIAGIFASVNELRDGVPINVQPTHDRDIIALCRGVFETFAGMGHVGPCNLQGRSTDQGLVLYEINPRFTGITAVRAAMGFNECEAALRLFVNNDTPDPVADILTYDTDTVCLRYITEQLIPRSEIERLV